MQFVDMSQYKAKFQQAERLGKAEAATYQPPVNEDDAPSGFTDTTGTSPQPQPQDPDYLYRVYLSRYGRRG